MGNGLLTVVILVVIVTVGEVTLNINISLLCDIDDHHIIGGILKVSDD